MGKGFSRPRGYVYEDNVERDIQEEQEREPRRQRNYEKQNEIERQIIHLEEVKSDGCVQQYDEEKVRRELKELQLEYYLCKSRKALFDYKFGDKSKKTLHPHVTQLRIALFGPTGSGKSCFINTCERAVRGAEVGLAESSSGEEWTVTLQDYLPEMFFHLVDTRGFFHFDRNETVEFQNILQGKIQPGDVIHRPMNGQAKKQELHKFPAFEKRVHGVILVVKANDPRLKHGTFKEYLQPVRKILCENGIEPITVVTHYDLLPEQERETVRREASEATGSSLSYTLFIWNYTKENRDRNTEKERMALEILQRAVEESERAVIRVMEETVPQEILERGLLALEAYNKARSEGTTVVKRVPIMLIGQYCSGKTSLKKSLKGQCFNQEEEGTSGIDADPSFFKVSHELWKVGEKDQDASPNSALLLNRHLAKCTVEHLSLKKILEVGSAGAVAPEDSDSKDVSQYLAPESSFMGVTERETLCCEELPMMPEIPDGTSDSLAHIKTGPEIENDRESKERLGNVAEILLQKIIPNEEDVYSMMWDFAGESVYYTIHPIFLTPKAIYLLVHDLSQDAHAPAKPVRYRGRYQNYTDSHCLKQNVDYLYFWMSLVASLANHCDSDPSNTTSKTLPESLPPVFLVCTHADEPFDHTDAKTLARSVYGSLMDKPSRTHLCKDFFFVDNTKSGKELECSEVVRLRKVVLAACNELQKKREAIPIKWLEFENAIQEKKENGFKYILLEEAIGMAQECDISDNKQFQTLMNFLHDQRVLIHFTETPELDKLVVLDCQWLIDVFKRAITVTPYEGEDNEFAGLWKTFEEEGILKEDLLKHVWSPFLKDKITYGSLVAIMEKFSLLCSLPLSNPSDAKEYLVPSMLMSLPLDDVKNLVDSSRIPSLFIKFKSGQVPPGLFHRLMLQFFQRSQGKQSSELRPCLSQDFSRFYPDEKKNFSVILLRHSSSIEVVFHSGEQPDVKCVQKVRRKLELVLESMRNEFRWLKGMRYEVAFICPVCCQRGAVVSQCRTHKIQSCKQEECLHFWFESEINEESNCRKNATAKDSRVRIEKFAPWTALREIQVTNDRHAETHAACEKEIPAVEYFLSECACDATPDDFFLKLTTILELDQASLKDPNSATRTVIRTLARRAKDLERVDVFKHLRNVVPAGVIGPTLAEHIDVSDIPLDQRRRLTMNLSSGEEWKMVAEELGLKPFEIQFLDKRHKDPFEAVLSFVSQQGPLSVGSLYDLLNKLGYPLMADVL